MKRSITVFLILLLSVVLFAACSSEPVSTEPLTDEEIAQMYTDPAAFKGRPVTLTGKVFLVERDADAVYMQVYQDPENYENNTIIGYADPDFDVEDDDYIKVTGTVEDEFEGTNAYGGSVTAPMIVASTLEISSYQEVMAPTILEVVPEKKTVTHLGYSVTVQKIEFAENETRVYLKVKNGGKSEFSLYSFYAVLIQGNKQYEEQSNWDAEYPEIQTDLKVGIESEGIICFPAINQEDFQLEFEGSSDNYREDVDLFKFNVKVE
jgi:hypothetical protein